MLAVGFGLGTCVAFAAETKSVECTNCGVITSIEKVTQKGEGTGLGMAAGAVLGAVAGREIVGGKRSHRNAAAVAGAVGGGYAGHQVEKSVRSTTNYMAKVRMDSDFRIEPVELESAEGWLVGDKVYLDNGVLTHRKAD